MPIPRQYADRDTIAEIHDLAGGCNHRPKPHKQTKPRLPYCCTVQSGVHQAHPAACNAPLPPARQSSLLTEQAQHTGCLNYLHCLRFVLKRPKKRLVKADEAKRDAFVAEYGARRDEAHRYGAKIFFASEAHFRADAELRGKWVLKRESALVDSTSPRYGEKATYYSAVCLEDVRGGMDGARRERQLSNIGCLLGPVAPEALRAVGGDLGQRTGAPGSSDAVIPGDPRP